MKKIISVFQVWHNGRTCFNHTSGHEECEKFIEAANASNTFASLEIFYEGEEDLADERFSQLNEEAYGK